MQVNDRNAPLASPGGRRRWIVVSLLFAAMVINYVDRQMIGVLKPTLIGRVRLDRDGLRRHRLLVPGGLCRGLSAVGADGGRIGARWGFGIAFVIWQIGLHRCMGRRSAI
jgi:ACS family hexuronate transporter-like MFS transporter